MLQAIAAHIAALPLALQLVGLCALLAVADFVFALAAAIKPPNTFHGTLLGNWILTKGLPIVVIALLYGLDAAIKLAPINVAGVDMGIFGALAYAQAVTFIAQEAFSVIKNAKMFTSPPVDDPVPEENPTVARTTTKTTP